MDCVRNAATRLFVVPVFFLFSISALAADDRIVQQTYALADYIEGDYAGAVSSGGGEILSPDEYREMTGFASLIGDNLEHFQADGNLNLTKKFDDLERAIRDKKPPEEVKLLARIFKKEIQNSFSLKASPPPHPDLKNGEHLYARHCADCHGLTGDAQAPAASKLNPPPRSFVSDEVSDNLYPYKVFNTLTFGVAGTAMPSFENLSEDDRWALASYVMEFTKKGPPSEEIFAWTLRTLKESLNHNHLGNTDEALTLAVSAYLDGFEKIENFLMSSGFKNEVILIERQFMNYREALRMRPLLATPDGEKLIKAILLLKSKSEQEPLSWWIAFVASWTIIFREGLEAILLLAIILSAVNLMQEHRLKKWVHGSWVAALAVGLLTYLTARNLISGIVREGMEGWITLLAAAVLIYVSYWFFAKTDVKHWKAFLVGRLKGKGTVGFITVSMVSFLAVYREAFETVLFFETLRIKVPHQTTALYAGVAAGFAVLALSTWIIFRLGRKIPLALFFGVSGLLLYFLAVVFSGQGIHSLQEAGLVSHTVFPFFTLKILGIFPTFETFVPQLALVTIFVMGLIWQQVVKKPRVAQKFDADMKMASTELFNIHEQGEHLLGHLNQLKIKLGNQRTSQQEMKEIIGHMEDLDRGIHQVILHVEKLHSEIPQQFDELYQEVQALKGEDRHLELVNRAQEFKKHLDTLKLKL